ncbi:CATRA system-associated protein [Micromonospora sp. 4G57]|uniref:CATRA system-associated protein n=1 Tax=Micromonospora sicca TaxID=2202420 RepID=A0ABU5JN21_9ACTN|nr:MULTISPECIES: CATRA system-associated protein [unclassified Micromonospora]MDZ5446510.1 CATRA system-associated protein [Micromonospora sp. 4G57]MDZ5494035.1 CATRA system-associated protein [Micromonospora sp. 4G53]
MDTRWDPETVTDALNVLRDVADWRLAPERWERVEDILRSMEEAFAAGDPAGLRAATADLEVHGPVRLRGIGTKPASQPSEPVRDRQNRLVHALDGIALRTDVTADDRPDGERVSNAR